MSASDQPWSGIFPALCTPFTADGAVDVDAQRAVVRFALACGAAGIVCFGLAGEVNKLTPEERTRLSRVIIDEVNGRVPVLVGVGTEALHTSVALARHAQEAGAAGIVIPPPLTAHLDGEGLVPYFCAIAATTRLPVVIQDAPDYLGVGLSPSLVQRLAVEQPTIRYVKIETGPAGTARWIAELRPNVNVFTGGAGLHLLSDLRTGAVGNVPGTELTDLLVSVYRAEKHGDGAEADALFQRLLPYLEFSLQGIDHYNACTKEILVRRGILRQGGLRLPAPPLTSVSRTLLETYVAELGLDQGTSREGG